MDGQVNDVAQIAWLFEDGSVRFEEVPITQFPRENGGLAAAAGAFAEWEEFEHVMDEIVKNREKEL